MIKIPTKKTQKDDRIRIVLTIPTPMHKLLLTEKQKYMHYSIQEVILEAIRDKYLRAKPIGQTKRGRPKKIDEIKLISRKKIFSKTAPPHDL